MGFKICQSFYDKAADKKKAIEQILTIKDFRQFLLESGYTEKFGKGQG